MEAAASGPKATYPVWESGIVRVSLSPKGRCWLGTLQCGLSHLEELVVSLWNNGRLVALGDREVKIKGIVEKKEELCHHLIVPGAQRSVPTEELTWSQVRMRVQPGDVP